ncbi:MAG: hypothetical protein ABFS42_05165 [Candidatus Krumholzibacteriota bacterium]
MKLILNALVIGALNLASFLIGFWIFSLSARGEQRLIQGTAAMVVAVLLVASWLVLFRKFNRLQVEFDYIRVFLLVFVCTPVLFVPVHYVITGYLTGIGNILAVAAYQFPMNALALAVAAAILRRMEKAPRGAF